MDLYRQLAKHRKDARWIIGGFTVLLLVLTAIYYLIQRNRDLPSGLVTEKLLLFVLLYVNVVLILTIIFVFGRNVFKLVIERQHGILGSRFKTKLLVTFVGLALVPVLLLFFVASDLLQGSIDRWFDTDLEEVLQQGNAVAQSMLDHVEQDSLLAASLIRRDLEEINLGRAIQRNQLGARLQRLLNEYRLDYLAIYAGTDFLQAVLRPDSGLAVPPEPDRRFLLEAQSAGEAIRLPPTYDGRLLLAAVPLTGVSSAESPVLVVGTTIEPDVAAQRKRLVETYQGHQQLKVQRSELLASYLLPFLMMTLFLILASSWVGLYLANRVTVPIQALAEGTRRISQGDLETRVDVEAGDELGVLVDSFNRMTAELKANKELLERSNKELVATNKRLDEERALIAAVHESVAAGVISVDPEGTILTCNRAACEMLGQDEEALRGRSITAAWADPERHKLLDLLQEAMQWRGRVTREIRLLLDGFWKVFEVKITSMRDASGEVSGRVMVLEELTELIKAKQLAAWRDAARKIAHEIKNPLTPIRLSAERMLRKHEGGGADLGRSIEEGVEIIKREVSSMEVMVDEFSRFARMPQPQPTEIDLGELVSETTRLYEGIKQGVEVETALDPAARTARLDGELMKRVLINLLDNAIEATEPPGEVTISTSRRDGTLEIAVSDTGSGIPDDAKEKLFLPHFSTKGRGTGLGLAIVHRIVSEHHGTIQADDNRPRGTVFTIRLPLE
ncbi:MAG: ATP-binding protein [Thermoanaerobaculia bacterium]|nr:ATP-binding protein [Thermoanaerobaculia bacterium]